MTLASNAAQDIDGVSLLDRLSAADAMANQAAYSDEAIVQNYARTADLKAPERAILDLVGHRLATMRMLDIGVGGGRTTLHFATRVREYVGIDYVADMIEACRRRFPETQPGVSFDVCDARDLARFADESFDFVLFSFNGIDTVPHDDRLTILREVSRVGRRGGLFCFSAHNLQFMETLCFGRVFSNYRTVPKNLRRWFRLRFIWNSLGRLNRLRQASYAVINDGLHGGRVRQYYIRPLAQIEQLTPRFGGVRVFRSTDGVEIAGDLELTKTEEPWVYYLCSIL